MVTDPPGLDREALARIPPCIKAFHEAKIDAGAPSQNKAKLPLPDGGRRWIMGGLLLQKADLDYCVVADPQSMSSQRPRRFMISSKWRGPSDMNLTITRPFCDNRTSQLLIKIR